MAHLYRIEYSVGASGAIRSNDYPMPIGEAIAKCDQYRTTFAQAGLPIRVWYVPAY